MIPLKVNRRMVLLVVIAFCVSQLASCQRAGRSRRQRHDHKSEWKQNKSIKKLISILLKNDNSDLSEFKHILNSISIPRNVNSNGHRHVRKFIESTVQNLSPNWQIEEDSFSANTPLGQVSKFRNIIATYLPTDQLCGDNNQTQPRIILSCHYDSLNPSLVQDSKSTHKRHKFVGATDAAVSCSILLWLAQFMTPYLKLMSKQAKPNTPTLQLVFFDGEEALQSSHVTGIKSSALKTGSAKSNSLYGSRHLARLWESTARQSNASDSHKSRLKSQRLAKIAPKVQQLMSASQHLCKRYRSSLLSPIESRGSIRREEEVIDTAVGSHDRTGLGTSQGKRGKWSSAPGERVGQLTDRLVSLHQAYHTLANIKLFILLDLIGGSNPRFFNTNLQTSKYFRRLATIEKHLLAQSTDEDGTKLKPFFQTSPSFVLSLVRDDHLPFVVRNVPVVHLIPSPFPRNWHTTSDDLDSLNFDAIRRIMRVMQIFLLDSLKH